MVNVLTLNLHSWLNVEFRLTNVTIRIQPLCDVEAMLRGDWEASFFFVFVFWVFCFLFIYLGFFVPVDNFSLIWRRHHYRWRSANVDVYSVFMAIEQWGFFSVPHLMWHGPTLYSCHFRGPVALTPVAERLAVELSLPVLTSKVCRRWDSNIQPSACETNALFAGAVLYDTIFHVPPSEG